MCAVQIVEISGDGQGEMKGLTGPNQTHPIAIKGPSKEIQDSTWSAVDELAVDAVEVGIDLTTQVDQGECET
jgi:hypothetical protein